MKSLGFSTYNITLSAHRDSCNSSFLIGCLLFIYFCLITLARTTSAMLNKSGKSRHPCFLYQVSLNWFWHGIFNSTSLLLSYLQMYILRWSLIYHVLFHLDFFLNISVLFLLIDVATIFIFKVIFIYLGLIFTIFVTLFCLSVFLLLFFSFSFHSSLVLIKYFMVTAFYPFSLNIQIILPC